MTESATLARPYAAALLRVVQPLGEPALLATAVELNALALVAQDPQIRQLVHDPKIQPQQVLSVLSSAVEGALSEPLKQCLLALIDNARVLVLPELAQHFQALVNESVGFFDAHIQSAFAIEPEQLNSVVQVLEKRFARRLNPIVSIVPELIGGIKVQVGDEVLDASVLARLRSMRAALSA